MRPVLFALSAAVSAGLLVLIVADAVLGDDFGRVANFVVALTAFVGGGCGWAAHFIARGRLREGLTLSLGTIAIVLGALFSFMIRRASSSSSVLLGTDRAALSLREVDGETFLEHPSLGFRLPRFPVQIEENARLEREMLDLGGEGYARDHVIWAFESRDHDSTLAIDLSLGSEHSVAALSALADHVTGPLNANGATVEAGGTVELGACMDRLIYARLSSGGHLSARVSLFRRNDRTYRMVMTAIGPEDYRAFLSQVSFDCAPTSESAAPGR